MLFQSRLMNSLLAIPALLLTLAGSARAMCMITTPASGTTFGLTATVSVGGMSTETPGTGFTIYVYRDYSSGKTVMNTNVGSFGSMSFTGTVSPPGTPARWTPTADGGIEVTATASGATSSVPCVFN